MQVTPRIRFRCPTCSTTKALGADPRHFIERSACIQEFTKAYGMMPLKSSEFRVDPGLFKEPDVPGGGNRYKDIGTIYLIYII